MATSSASMDPEDMRRIQSGVWTREFDAIKDVIRWSCDINKLAQKIAERVQSDRVFAQQFTESPASALDYFFGEGTGRAFFTKRENTTDPRVHMAIPTRAYMDSFRNMLSQERLSFPYGYRMYDQMPIPHKKKTASEAAPIPVPVISKLMVGDEGLLDALQKSFDRWAGKQVELVRQWVQ